MFSVLKLLNFGKQLIAPLQFAVPHNGYAVAVATGKGKKGGKTGKIVLDVETDTNRLVNYCCGTNILKEGGEDVKLKPDSEYPDWLWTLRLGKVPPLEELDPNSWFYWKQVRKQQLRRNNRLKRTKHAKVLFFQRDNRTNK